MNPSGRLVSAAIVCVLALVPTAASASLITITNNASGTGRATFGGNDIVDWGGLGPDLTFVPQPFSINSTNGLNVSVSKVDFGFLTFTQGVSWLGNFTDGSNLLYGNNGPFTLDFGGLVKGVGFQINPDYSIVTGTTLEVFGAGNVSFGTFNLTTNNSLTASASFIGVTSDLFDIARVVISQPGLGYQYNDFAINQLSLIDQVADEAPPVPEPASLLLVGGGLAIAARRLRGRIHTV